MRSRITLRVIKDKKKRNAYIKDHGLTIKLEELLSADKGVIVEVSFPQYDGKEYWYTTALLTDELLVSVPDTTYKIISQGCLIVDNDFKVIRKHKIIEDTGIKIVSLRVRW